MIYDMRMTFNIPDKIARDLITLVPNRKRSHLLSQWIQQALEKKKGAIIKACQNANKDAKTDQLIQEWQGFDEEVDGEWK